MCGREVARIRLGSRGLTLFVRGVGGGQYFILIDFSSGGRTHILNLKLFVNGNHSSGFSLHDFEKSLKS